jgi:Response regulator containing a CheY-like receiver domain and an HTH DNA-binding domain
MSEAMGVLILSNNRLFADCLKQALATQEEMAVLKLVSDLESAAEKVKAFQPDMILIDVSEANDHALELTQGIRIALPLAKLIILGLPESESLILRYIEAGAHGYLTRDSCFQDLLTTIASVHRGETVCSTRIAYSLFSRMSELADRSYKRKILELNLTNRELEILYLIADGLSNKQIAQRINLALSTVKNHVHSILEKLRLHNRSEAVHFALTEGILDKDGLN